MVLNGKLKSLVIFLFMCYFIIIFFLFLAHSFCLPKFFKITFRKLLLSYNYNFFCRKGCCTDYNKPLLIPNGADSFAQLDVNIKSLPSSYQGIIIERFKHVYTATFPQVAKAFNFCKKLLTIFLTLKYLYR